MRFQEEGLPLTTRQMVLAVLTGAPLPDDMPKKSCLLYRCENKAEFAAGTPSFDVWGLRPIGLVGPRENPVDVVPFLAAGAELAPSEGAGGQAPTERKKNNPTPHDPLTYAPLTVTTAAASFPHVGGLSPPRAALLLPRRRPPPSTTRRPPPSLAPDASLHHAPPSSSPAPAACLHYAPPSSFPGAGRLPPPPAALLLPRRRPPASTTRRPPPRHAAAALLPPPACRRRPAPFPSATLPPCSLPQRAPATVAARSTAATLVRSPLPTKAVRRRSTTQRSALADHSHPPQAVERHLRRRFIAAATWILLVPTSDVYSSMSSLSSCSVARLLHLVQVRDGGC
nr:protein transport protein sec31-like [Aegilops tauschii subsp. strangulata]